MAAHFTGQEVNLAVVEVVRASRKVVCSVVKAKENDDLRQLEVGTLVTGTVRRIEPFGVFVGINGTRVSGLLHISNVSRQHIETVQARALACQGGRRGAGAYRHVDARAEVRLRSLCLRLLPCSCLPCCRACLRWASRSSAWSWAWTPATPTSRCR